MRLQVSAGLIVLVMVVAVLALQASALGQATTKGEPPASTTTHAAPGAVGRFLLYVQTQQRRFYRNLAGAIRDVRNVGSWAAAWALIALSLLYGVFHAAGPGHGKAILSTYLLTHRSDVRRGIAMAVASAALQGIVAIVLVEALVAMIGWTRREAFGAVGTIESVSYGLIALVGIGLVINAGRILSRGFRGGRSEWHEHSHAGHAHIALPDPNRTSLRSVIAVVLSIGIRPCSGAVLVLLLAHALQLRLAGFGAVAAMSLGTAATVAALALIAVYARRLAVTLGGAHSDRFGWIGGAAALIGGAVIAALGATLFVGSLGSNHPLL